MDIDIYTLIEVYKRYEINTIGKLTASVQKPPASSLLLLLVADKHLLCQWAKFDA